MQIKWHGTASVTIKTSVASVSFDPYLHKLNPELPPVDAEEIKNSDAIFITHPHADHFADVASFMNGKTPVYVSPNGIKHAGRARADASCMRPVRIGEKYTIGDITISVVQSRHCRFDLPLILSVLFSLRTYRLAGNAFRLIGDSFKFRIRDDVYFFLIEAEGKKIALLGSAGLDKATEYPTDADLLILPYQGRSDMAEYSLRLLSRLRPKRVLLDHYDDAFPPFTGKVDTQKIVLLASREFPEMPVAPFKQGLWYEL